MRSELPQAAVLSVVTTLWGESSPLLFIQPAKIVGILEDQAALCSRPAYRGRGPGHCASPDEQATG
jgi:hypothetical protein